MIVYSYSLSGLINIHQAREKDVLQQQLPNRRRSQELYYDSKPMFSPFLWDHDAANSFCLLWYNVVLPLPYTEIFALQTKPHFSSAATDRSKELRNKGCAGDCFLAIATRHNILSVGEFSGVMMAILIQTK